MGDELNQGSGTAGSRSSASSKEKIPGGSRGFQSNHNNFLNQFNEVIMTQKHISGNYLNHKNLARLDFIRSINPVVAEKLKGMMQEHKAKEKGK
ncbi:hypothetical protein PSNIH2_13510 [Pantoea sp. PSNIH2]|nr:hypothetical protein PSNIH2_13510 [Pantoea sp. PSNIH2]